MSNGVNGERNAVLDTDFAHEFRDVGFDGTFLNAESRANFLVRPAGYKEFQHFFLAIGKRDPTCRENASRRGGDAFNEN